MNNVTRVTLLLLALIFTNSHAHEYTDPYRLDPFMFDSICRYMEVNCEGLEAPNVVFTQLVDTNPFTKTNGIYIQTEPNIYINPHSDDISGTIVHETIHYIIFELNLPYTRCEGEAKARLAAGQPWDLKTQEWYGCQPTK